MTDTTLQTLIDDPAIESVEIKLTVRDDQEQLVHDALGHAHVKAEHRVIYFFDTNDLELYESGLVLRARKIKGHTDNSTVKLRPVDPAQIPEQWKGRAEFHIEMDVVGEKFVCSAKVDSDEKRGEIDEVVAGERAMEKLFSGVQEELIKDYAPADVDWSVLVPLGPIEVRKWEFEPEGLDHELTVEMWVLPDGTDLVELSIKVDPAEAESSRADLASYLAGGGFDIEGDQKTKTKTALAYFTNQQL